MMTTAKNTDYPRLPRLVRLPLRTMPAALSHAVIGRSLSRLFAVQLQEDELDFMRDRQINIGIEDAGLDFSLRLEQQRLVAGLPAPRPDLSISGTVYAFLLLAAREEDADTLFFRRELRSQGDTELGLYVKNFLDGIDLETLPASKLINQLVQGALKLANIPGPGLPQPLRR